MDPVARNWVRFWNRMLPALLLGWVLCIPFLAITTSGTGDLASLLLVPPLLLWILGHLVLWATRGLRE
jgi:hypothetical protein